MWVKLGNEYLNLDQVIRVRFAKAFRAGQEEWSAEVETLIKGEIQIVTRYRGSEATTLQSILATQVLDRPAPRTPDAVPAPHIGQALSTTVHDIKLP